jgi:hypothetical protein
VFLVYNIKIESNGGVRLDILSAEKVGLDAKTATAPAAPAAPDVLEIHTSDRIAFKRCRRKWYFSSPLCRYLVPQAGVATPLWFGTGYHFALEDYHGFQLWPTVQDAFAAYANACPDVQRPYNVEELCLLANQMLEHYVDWCEAFHGFVTYMPVVDDVVRLGCEVEFRVDLPQLLRYGYRVQYVGTFDSIFEDPSDRSLWIGEYKTAAAFDIAKLATDDQISAYLWALNKCLPFENIAGVVYRQMRKKAPSEPLYLQNGSLSTNKSQKTSYFKYRRALANLHPNVPIRALSPEYQKMLMHLAGDAHHMGDDYISERQVRRSKNALRAQGQKILVDSYEMLNSPAITTNPTRDCTWECNFREICLAMDEGADWEEMLKLSYGPREQNAELWKTNLHVPPSAARHVSWGLDKDVGITWADFKRKRGLVLYGTANNDEDSNA